jgi:hypothetical protein
LPKFKKYIEDRHGRIPVPYIDMRNPPDVFRQKIEHALALDFQVLGLVYRNPVETYANFLFINSLSDRPIWIHVSGVGRYWRLKASQMHMPQNFGIDTCSLDARKGGGGGCRPTPDMIKRYDRGSLALLLPEVHRETYGEVLGCNCPLCQGKTLSEFYNEYSHRPNGKVVDAEYLRKVSCVHEAFASREEFQAGRNYVKKNEFKSYVQHKSALKDALADVVGKP